MKKRHFLPLFRAVWRTSFTKTNIQHAFKKPSIWPYDSSLVLSVITRPITPPEAIQPSTTSSTVLKTPRSAKSICHFQNNYRKNPTTAKLQKLFKANEELSTQVALDKHIKEGLIESLKREKKSHNWGKRLNLLGEEDNGPQLFSTLRVKVAQAFQAAKEEKARIASNKAATAAKKAKDDAIKAEKALQAAARAANKDEVEAQEKAEKQAQKQKEAQAKKALKDPPAKAKAPAKPKKTLACKKKVVRFDGVDLNKVVSAKPPERTSSDRAVKVLKIFEKGT